jgi:hypothetical protein
MAAATSYARFEEPDEPQTVTLLELVRAFTEVADDEREVIATVLHMLTTGSVRLCGILRDEPIDSFLN